jgi:putative protease
MSVELLMPAGNVEKMKYAFAYGADAVYLGMPRFSLRARENDFKKRELVADAIKYAHDLGKKVYVTANILPHNHKVDPFINYVKGFLDLCKPDAWIMADPGLIMLMRENFPEEVIHLSVQANTVNFATAKFWQAQGVERIILSRELGIKEISVIKEHCPDLELEAFVHGAICIAYSGRCLISNYMSNRDPNQGTCTNSCRWKYKVHKKDEIQPQNMIEEATPESLTETQQGDPYVPLKGDFMVEEEERPGEFMPIDEDENGTYLMNSKDLCAIEHLEEMHKAGIMSFKVEGRTKSVYYVAMIARAYRKAIDDMLEGKPFNREHLRDVFSTSNRGLTVGFINGNPGKGAQEYETGRSKATCYRFSGIVRGYDEETKMMKVEPRNPIKVGMQLEMLKGDQTEIITVDKILNDKLQEVDTIHGGMNACFIPYPENPGEFVLFREQLEEFSLTS